MERIKVADTDKGDQALADIKTAVEAMSPEQIQQLGWMATGMALMASKSTADQPKKDAS